MGEFTRIFKANPGKGAAIVGVAIGVGAGVYFLSGYVNKKLHEMSPSRSLLDDYTEMAADYGDEWPDIPEGVNIAASDSISESDYEKPEHIDYTVYSGSSKNYSTTNPAKTLEDDENDAIVIISEEEYLNAANTMTKCDGTYFTSEKILAGWNDQLQERDIPTTVGWKAVHMFDDPSVKSVYVRNTELAIDFEIVRCDDPYAEAVTESAEEV